MLDFAGNFLEIVADSFPGLNEPAADPDENIRLFLFFFLHNNSLLGFSMKSVLAAKAAILVELQPVGVVLLVLESVVVSLLTL